MGDDIKRTVRRFIIDPVLRLKKAVKNDENNKPPIEKREPMAENIINNDAKKEETIPKPKVIEPNLYELINNGEYQTAANIINEKLKEDPKNDYLLTQLIKVYTFMKKKDEARKVFDEAIARGVDSNKIYYAMLETYLRIGTDEERVAFVEETLKANKIDERIYKNILKIYEKLEIFNKDELFERTRQIFVNSLELMKQNKFCMDIHFITLVIKNYIKFERDEIAEMLFWWAKTEKLVDNHIYSTIINLYKKKDKLDEAIELFNYALKEGRVDVVIYSDMIEIYGKKKMIKEAEECFSKGCAIDDKNVYLYTAMMNAYHKNEMVEKAKEIFYKAREKGVCDQQLLANMLHLCLISNELELGKKISKELEDEIKKNNGLNGNKALLKNTNGANTKVSYYLLLSSYYYKEKNYEEIENLLKNADEEIRQNYDIQLTYAESLRKRKKKDITDIRYYSLEAYSIANEIASKIMQKYKDVKNMPPKEYDNYIRAMIITAYCIKDDKRIEKKDIYALGIFRDLLEKVNEDNIHYARILCGYVFCDGIKTLDEAIDVKKKLEKCLSVKKENSNIKKDILEALGVIKTRYNV